MLGFRRGVAEKCWEECCGGSVAEMCWEECCQDPVIQFLQKTSGRHCWQSYLPPRFFPTCQVRVVRFYVRPISSFSSFSSSPAASVPCRTSTATIMLERMSDRMSGDMPDSVRRYVRKNCRRYVRKMSEKIQTECQKICQNVRKGSEDMPARMSEIPSGDVPERLSEERERTSHQNVRGLCCWLKFTTRVMSTWLL